MYIADMHCDSLSAVTGERGLKTRYNTSYEYPSLQFYGEFVPHRGDPAEIRRKRLMHYLDVYLSEIKRLEIVSVFDIHDLNFAISCERPSSILTVEGGGGLFADSVELETLHRAGLRVLGMAWDNNELATASGDVSGAGLTEEGKKLATRATEMGIILDVSHLSDRSTAELLDLTPYPLLATHSNFRSLCDHPRNLPDHLASKIAARGGVIGISIYPKHLAGERQATLDDVIRHIDFGLEHFGEGSVGFGFDLDGTDGTYPLGLDERDSIHDRVIDALSHRYSDDLVARISGGNVIEFLKNNL